jgi:hypothetical protein
MVRHVIRLAEDGAQAEIVGQVGGEPSRAPATDSDQCAARGQVGIRGPVGVRPARGIARRRHITAEPVTRQWDGVQGHLGGACTTDGDAHPGEDRDFVGTQSRHGLWRNVYLADHDLFHAESRTTAGARDQADALQPSDRWALRE